MSSWLLAVRGRVDDPIAFLTLRWQFDGVRVVEAGDHDVSVFTNSIFGIQVVVVQGIGSDPHLLVVGFLRLG